MLQQRAKKLRNILQEKNLDGFLVSNFYNILYLTGFKTLTNDEREGWGLITAKNVYLFTDSRYLNIKSAFQILKLITPEKGLIKHLQEIVTEEKIQRLGFEGDDSKVNDAWDVNNISVGNDLCFCRRCVYYAKGGEIS